jgi:galactose mutarotase-like enzyme
MADITIGSSELTATISPLGAELQNLRDHAGRDYLHDGASFWPSRAPILFPIVGALKDNRHEVDGAAYELPKHGFARRSAFAVIETAPERALFRLEDSAATLAQYPYRFRLDVAFALDGATLATTATVTNTDSRPIPVAFGFHPAFRWPLPGAGDRLGHVLDFAEEEPAPIARIDAEGLIAREEPTPVGGRRLALNDALFDDDALLFLRPRSRALGFGPADGGAPALRVRFEGCAHLGVWTKPGGAPFLCIEPWQGHASPAGFAGPLTEKPGSTILAPGAVRVFAMGVTLA